MRIGAVNAATSYILGPVLTQFHASYPDVQLRVSESGSLDIVSSVKAGELEMGLVMESDWMPLDRSMLDSQTLLHGPSSCVCRGTTTCCHGTR